MSQNPEHIISLINDLADKTNQSLDGHGFQRISDYVEEFTGTPITNRYLKETYINAINAQQSGTTKTKFYLVKIDLLAKVLGYKNFNAYADSKSAPLEPQLLGCIGTWWSIVRANMGNYLLKAPVRITKSPDHNIMIELKGGLRTFNGTATHRVGNIFCELDAGKDKKLYIVLKIGTSENPLLLQGTFAGISSAGDPIAGRELFVREDKMSYEEMKWEKIPCDTMVLDKRINSYFETYEGNCLKVNKVSTFSMTDLD